MDLRYEAQKILERADYHITRLADKEWLLFEDETLFGFIRIASTVEEIVGSWEVDQDSFLARNAIRLRSFPLKAWNAYSIFITDAECPPAFKTDLLKIEEDFRGTRKIVQTEIASFDDLYAALFPLLPIKNLVTLKSIDSLPRLESRLSFLKASELEALRKGDAGLSIVEILLEEQ
jgi:hypothetical protein